MLYSRIVTEMQLWQLVCSRRQFLTLRPLKTQLFLEVYNYASIIESDCQTMVNELQCRKASCQSLDNLFQDIKTLMTCFQLCSIQFSHRQSNKVAYILAIYAWNVNHIVMWYGEIPIPYLKLFDLINDNAIMFVDWNEVYPFIKKKRKDCFWINYQGADQ